VNGDGECGQSECVCDEQSVAVCLQVDGLDVCVLAGEKGVDGVDDGVTSEVSRES